MVTEKKNLVKDNVSTTNSEETVVENKDRVTEYKNQESSSENNLSSVKKDQVAEIQELAIETKTTTMSTKKSRIPIRSPPRSTPGQIKIGFARHSILATDLMTAQKKIKKR